MPIVLAEDDSDEVTHPMRDSAPGVVIFQSSLRHNNTVHLVYIKYDRGVWYVSSRQDNRSETRLTLGPYTSLPEALTMAAAQQVKIALVLGLEMQAWNLS